MKNTKRSAFTIVELVIVIAVIAILSAVLIPTFGAIIKDANIAADQTAASTLTTELHVDLMGETIDSEAELMERIAKIDEKKLTPKAAAYGVHFWFDMDNQMILAKTAKEIEDLVKEKNAESAYVEHTGVQLINDAQPAAAPASLNINFRSILGGNFFLIDKGGSAFVNALNKIAEFSGTSHADLVTAVNNVFLDVAADDQAFVDKFKAALASTVIITENALLQPESASYVYFDPEMQFVNDHGTISSITSGIVNLPSSVICVATNALVFGSTDVVLNTACKDASDVEFVFANASTNATIKTAADSYKIADGTGKVTIDETNAPANKIVPASSINTETGVGSVVPNITLCTKLNCEDFDVYVESGVPGDNAIAYNTSNNEPTLYVSYLDYAKAGKEIELSILANGNVIKGGNSAITWNYNGVDTHKVTLDSNTESATVYATARNIKGVDITKSLKIVVVKPTAATVSIGEKAINIGTGAVQTPSFEWGYDGTNGTREITFEVTGYTHELAHGTSNISVTVDSEAFTYNEATKELTLNTRGGDGDDAINLAKTGAVDITLSIDGVLQTTVKATLIDYTKAEFESNFHYTASTDRPYYIGKGEITLGHILKLKNSELTYDNYNVSVEVVFANAYVKVENLKNSGWEVDYDTTLTDENWDSTKINIKSAPAATTPIRVKITPAAANSDAYTVAINLTYVNGTNVLDAASLLTAATAENTNVVIMTDITLADTLNSSNYSLNFTTNETLYGNGFVINATNYVSGALQTYYKWEQVDTITYCNNENCGRDKAISENCRKASYAGGHRSYYNVSKGDYNNIVTEPVYGDNPHTCYVSSDAAFIELNGGTLDNIYINGPVYPTLQYELSNGSVSGAYFEAKGTEPTSTITIYTVDTPYYVSGIKATGTSTIKNSYVSGFRQPVKVDGATVNLNTTTLYGGNYANLQLIKGTINLHDVTTVQPMNGIADTFGEGKNVIGLGIAVEKDAVTDTTSAITITGYLDQYNWVTSDTLVNADLPELKIDGTLVKMDVVLAAMFKGVRVVIIGEEDINANMDFLSKYIQTDDSGKQYLNSGLMFMAFGPTSGDVASAAKNNSAKLTVNDNARIAGSLPCTKYSNTPLPLFSDHYAHNALEKLSITTDKLMRSLENFEINSDGKAEAQLGLDFLLNMGDPLDVYLSVWSYKNTDVNIFADDYNMTYPGYTYGN